MHMFNVVSILFVASLLSPLVSQAADPPIATTDPPNAKSPAQDDAGAKETNDQTEEVVYLDDLSERMFQVNYGTLGKHGSTGYPGADVQRCRLKPDGREVSHSLSIAPKSKITQRARTPKPNGDAATPAYVLYQLGKRYYKFRGVAAINYPTNEDGLKNAQKEAWKGTPESAVKFRVVGDGKVLWESRALPRHGDAQECDVTIEGVDQLRLEVTCEGSERFTWAFWADPRVSFKPKADLSAVPIPGLAAAAKSMAATAPANVADTPDDTASAKEWAKKLAEKASALAKTMVFNGKVAKVTPQVVYLTLGTASGIRVGTPLSVFRNMGEIKDPVSGAVLGMERPLISQLEVTEVTASYSKAKITSKLEGQIEIGDEVESKNKLVIAVCPLRTEDGQLSNQGTNISEEITTGLVEAGVKVVERSVLDSALNELIVQKLILFDPKSAQKLGELTGASYVVTGRIVTLPNKGTAFIRLVDVRSGEIALAMSGAVSTDGEHANSDQPDPTGSSNSGAKSTEKNLADGLPSFLTTTFLIQRVPGKGIRIQGHDKFTLRDQGAIRTKETNFLTKDFTFEVVVTFKAGDRTATIGLGPGIADSSYNGLKDCVYLRLPNGGQDDNEVRLDRFKMGSESVGRITGSGPHLVRIIKEGDKVTFQIDSGNDGKTDDDLETTIFNIREYAPFLHSKNMPLFFGGSGEYISASLK